MKEEKKQAVRAQNDRIFKPSEQDAITPVLGNMNDLELPDRESSRTSLLVL